MEESKQSQEKGEEVSTRIGHNECVSKDGCDISNKQIRVMEERSGADPKQRTRENTTKKHATPE